MIENLLDRYKVKLNADDKMKKDTWSKVEAAQADAGTNAESGAQAKKSGFPRKVLFGALFTFVTLFGVAAFYVGRYAVNYLYFADSGGDAVTEDDGLTYASSCSDLTKQLEEYAEEQDDWMSGILEGPGGLGRSESLSVPMASEGEESETGAGYYTETNVQVAGIDEGDVVKTDGSALFVINESSGKVEVLKIYPFDKAEKVAEMEIVVDESAATPEEMFIYEDTLVVFSQVYADWRYYEVDTPMFDVSRTMVSLYDVGDLDSPELVREFEVEGNFLTSRLKDGYVYVVSDMYVSDYENPVPMYRDSAEGDEFMNACDCEEIAVLNPDYYYPTFTTVFAMDMSDLDSDPSFDTYIGDTETVYMGTDNIYLVSNETEYLDPPRPLTGVIDEVLPVTYRNYTAVTKIGYDASDLDYVARVRFDGQLLNQFSLDEHEGYLRVAGTVGDAWDSSAENYLYIFDESLKRVSKIEGLAKTETIYSVRFYGDIGVVVTFKKTDPLFVFDLSDPENPVLKGELKIPGYSDYLHFLDEDTVIGLGKETVEAESSNSAGTDFAWYQGVKLAVFDISDLENPVEQSKMVIGDRGSDSQALYDHKAFVLDEKHDMIILPMLIAKVDPSQCGESYRGSDTGSCYGEDVWQGAYLISLSDDSKELSKYGQITHYDAGADYYSLYDVESVKRSIVVEDVVVTISDAMVKLNSLDDLEELSAIELSGEESEDRIFY